MWVRLVRPEVGYQENTDSDHLVSHWNPNKHIPMLCWLNLHVGWFLVVFDVKSQRCHTCLHQYVPKLYIYITITITILSSYIAHPKQNEQEIHHCFKLGYATCLSQLGVAHHNLCIPNVFVVVLRFTCTNSYRAAALTMLTQVMEHGWSLTRNSTWAGLSLIKFHEWPIF